MRVSIVIEDVMYNRVAIDQSAPTECVVEASATKCGRCALNEVCQTHGAPICDIPDGGFMDYYFIEIH